MSDIETRRLYQQAIEILDRVDGLLENAFEAHLAEAGEDRSAA